MSTPGYTKFFQDLTLSQILTYLEVYDASLAKKSLATLSRETGRDISAYAKTIDRLNDLARPCFEEHLLLRGFQKGMPWTPTPTGRKFQDFCHAVRACLDEHIQEMGRLELRRPVRIAMPQLPLHDMLKIEDQINAHYARIGKRFEKQLIHIRSEQLPTILLDQTDIDFAFGGLIEPGALDQSLQFVEIEQRRYNLISNFEFSAEHALETGAEVTMQFLQERKVPLLIANIGVIVDCLLRTLGATREYHESPMRFLGRIRERYNIVEECNDVHFMIELLCTSRHNLCMFGTPDIFMRAKDRAQSEEIIEFWRGRNVSGPMMYYQAVTDELPPLRVGVIRRRPAEGSVPFQTDHPCNLFWNASLHFATDSDE